MALQYFRPDHDEQPIIEGQIITEITPQDSPVLEPTPVSPLEYHRSEFLQSAQRLSNILFGMFEAAVCAGILLATHFSLLGTILLFCWCMLCIPLWFVGKLAFHLLAMRHLSNH